MKKFNNHTTAALGFLLCLLTSIQLWANPVDVATARRVAFNFMKTQGYNISSEKEMSNVSDILGLSNIYVFNTPVRPGYVVVSADDCCEPIVAFSSQGFFPEHPHRILLAWYDDCNNLIEYLSVRKAESTFASRWEPLLNRNQAKDSDTTDAPALWCMTTEWGTGAGYNKYCPFDLEGDGYHANAGSFAVAAAQIINYWGQKPEYRNEIIETDTGIIYPTTYYTVPASSQDSTLADNRPVYHYFYHGSKRYEDPTYGTQYANFARRDTIYDFDVFPDKKDQPSNPYQEFQYDADKMAEFIYHVGVSLEMQYDRVNSLPRRYPQDALRAGLGTYWGFENVDRGPRDRRLKTFGGANSSIHYNDGLRRETRLGRPFMFQFKDSVSGYVHYSVCDGHYKDIAGNEYAHLNMCDGGDGNGFYSLYFLDRSSNYLHFENDPSNFFTTNIVLDYIFAFTPKPYWFHTDKDYAEINELYGTDEIRIYLPTLFPYDEHTINAKEYVNASQSGLVLCNLVDGDYNNNYNYIEGTNVSGIYVNLRLTKATANDIDTGSRALVPTVFDNSIRNTTFSFTPDPWSNIPDTIRNAFWNDSIQYHDTTFTIPILYSAYSTNTPDTIICDNGEFDYAVQSEDMHSQTCGIQQHWGISFAPEAFTGYDTIIGFQYYVTDTEQPCGDLYQSSHGIFTPTANWPYQCYGTAITCPSTHVGWNTVIFPTPRLVRVYTSNGTNPFWIEMSARSNTIGAWAATSTGRKNSYARSYLCRPSENSNGSLDVGRAGERNTGEWIEVTNNIQWMIRPLVKGNGIPKPYRVEMDLYDGIRLRWYAPENQTLFHVVIGEKGYIPGNGNPLAETYLTSNNFRVDEDNPMHYSAYTYFEDEQGESVIRDGHDYDVFIRIVSGNSYGPWSDVSSVEMPCWGAQPLPYSEDFKNGCPRCWTDESETGYLTWLLNSGLWLDHMYNPDSTTTASKDGASANGEDFAMLVTPELDFSSLTSSQIAQLSFLQRQTCAVQADTDYMDVLYRIYDQTNYEWTSWTTLKRDTVSNNNIEAVTIDLPTPDGTWQTIQFAFNINVQKDVMAVFSDLIIQAVPRPASPAPDYAAPPMYPNPSTGVFTVDCPDVQEIEALDIMGRSVKKVLNTNVIDITNRPPGTYMLRVTSPAGVSVGKVSKQ